MKNPIDPLTLILAMSVLYNNRAFEGEGGGVCGYFNPDPRTLYDLLITINNAYISHRKKIEDHVSRRL